MSVIEKVQTFWDNRPCNIRHGTSPIGTKEYFDQVEARKYKVEPHLPKFANFSQWKDKNVLEIGCGLGTESVNFARAGAHLTIVELSAKSLELCKQRFAVFGLTATFIQGNAENVGRLVRDAHINLSGTTRKFDLIWSFGVIHHTPYPEHVIDGISELLKPDGELRIMLYSKVSYKMFWAMHTTNQWDMGRSGDIIQTHAEAQTGCPVAFTYDFDDIATLLDGFSITDIHKDHIFTWDIPHYINHEYVVDKTWENVSPTDLKNFERELGWHTLVTAHLK